MHPMPLVSLFVQIDVHRISSALAWMIALEPAEP